MIKLLHFSSRILFIVAAGIFSFNANGQDDLMSMLEAENPIEEAKVTATFKSMKLINAHTIEMTKDNHLDFRITHRFGNIGGASGGGVHTLYGFDQSEDIRISLDYGITENLQIGIGRSKRAEAIDGSIKYKILAQTDANSVPISLVWFSDFALTPQVDFDGRYQSLAHRMSYVHQVILARKFSDRISIEVLPTLVHRNLVVLDEDSLLDENTFFSLGVAGRFKINQRLSVVADYFHNFSDYRINHPTKTFYNPLGVGFELETGGHVFHLFLTNSSGIIENNYLTTTQDDWLQGGMKFGFNISRVFSL